ncbi:unnamed protein product [Urochloa decumbens]|uniref:BURP domain-containing protein n=1 Tax=Urochloa decumbens TaxID=240449 RepID=A0ABC8VHZ9_9POAL
MHPSTLLLIVVVTGASVVHGHPATDTPAAQFWQQVLPGTTMPEAIADLVKNGIEHSPLVEHYSAIPSISVCTLFKSACNPRTVAETGIFFHESRLLPGSTMTLSFPGEAATAILPHDVADKVPFGNLGDVLAAFNIPAGSGEADQVRHTLSRCQEPPVAGEVKSCTTSLESTVQSAMDMLGTVNGDKAVWAATSELPRCGLPRQPYVVKAVAPLDGNRYVSCHKVPFPYAVYQCHIAGNGYRAYVVSLSGLSGDKVASMLAFCHVDTSSWNPAHPAFEILNTRPGGTPVCHFMPYGDLAFVKKAGRAY